MTEITTIPVRNQHVALGLSFDEEQRSTLISNLIQRQVPTSPLILATVGTQFPFDRMLRALDRWARANPAARVVAQTHLTHTTFDVLRCRAFLDGRVLRRMAARADLIVAHAGMGSLLTALETRTPIIVLPRRAALGEHRNDHQRGSARILDEQALAHVAHDEHELCAKLSDPATWRPRFTGDMADLSLAHPLVNGVARFIAEQPEGRNPWRILPNWFHPQSLRPSESGLVHTVPKVR